MTITGIDTEARMKVLLELAYNWYRDNYGLEPHKETRHGGDQVAYAYALGLAHTTCSGTPSLDEQVRLLQVQAKWAPKGSIT